MTRIPKSLRWIALKPFQVNGSLLSDALFRTATSIVLAGFIAAALTLAGVDLLTNNPAELDKSRSWLRELIELVLVGPLLENSGLFVVGWLIQRVVRREGLSSLLLAGSFAALHALVDVRWGLIILPLFWMMSTALHAHRFGWAAFLSIGMIHALNNLFSFALSHWPFR